MAFTLVLGLVMMLPMVIAWLSFASTWFSGAAATSDSHVVTAQVEDPLVTEPAAAMLVDAAGDPELLDSAALDNALLTASGSSDPHDGEADESGMPRSTVLQSSPFLRMSGLQRQC